MLTCTHDSLHSRLLQTARHIAQVLNVSVCKDWNIHCLPAAKHNKHQTIPNVPHVDRNVKLYECSILNAVTETHNNRDLEGCVQRWRLT